MLPNFRNPPVVEVALAVGFQALPRFRTVEAGALWSRYKTELPKVAEQPPVQMQIEEFGKAPAAPQVSFELLSSPPMPRLWFSNEAETHLLQVQSNWFARNWRKQPSGATYPRYPMLRKRFARDLRTFVRHVAEEDLGRFAPTQCEVTYINHIPLRAGARLAEILRPLGRPRDLPPPESENWGARFVFGSPPSLRLHVTAEPATRRSNRESIVVLTITGRGAPQGSDVEQVLAFLDRAHDHVVQTFDSLTTDSMHKMWGKTAPGEIS